MAFHAAHSAGNVLVRASDTDVLVILLGMLGKQAENNGSYMQIFMDFGSGNSRRHIDVTKIASTLEAKKKGLAAAMPGLHAFTGCDYTSAFYRKGKIKPLELLMKEESDSFTQLFKELSSQGVEDESISTAEEFVCNLYGMKDDSVNGARYTKLINMSGKVNEVNEIIF